MRLNTLIAAVMVAVASTAAYGQEVSICDYPTDGYGELAEQAVTVLVTAGLRVGPDGYENWGPRTASAEFADRIDRILVVADAFRGLRANRRGRIAPSMEYWMLQTELAIRLVASTMLLDWRSDQYADLDDSMDLFPAYTAVQDALLSIGDSGQRAVAEWHRMAMEAGC